MHDKKPLNKTNYTPHQNGSMPPKLQTAYNERDEKNQRLRNENVPHIKNAKVLFPETPPILHSCRDCMQGIPGH